MDYCRWVRARHIWQLRMRGMLGVSGAPQGAVAQSSFSARDEVTAPSIGCAASLRVTMPYGQLSLTAALAYTHINTQHASTHIYLNMHADEADFSDSPFVGADALQPRLGGGGRSLAQRRPFVVPPPGAKQSMRGVYELLTILRAHVLFLPLLMLSGSGAAPHICDTSPWGSAIYARCLSYGFISLVSV
eukprot:scaffold6987_cov21-Tisochrysis_lutea.AAC.2